jgi:biopolymer transport protein ExbB
MPELFVRGGPLVYLLLVVSVTAMAIILERGLFFLFIRADYKVFVQQIEKHLAAGEIKYAKEAAAGRSGPVGRVLETVIKHWDKKVSHLHEIVGYEANRAVGELEKRLRGLAVIAQTAPLIGLLGTVVGMIHTFIEIESHGGDVQVSVLAGGIWEALSTTAFGLAIAIPVLIIFNYFEAKVDDYVKIINYCSGRLLRLHEEKQ